VVLLLVSVEAVISCFVYFAPIRSTSQSGLFSFPLLAFGLVEVVDGLVIENFSLFVFC
jgi:hypothetical protein